MGIVRVASWNINSIRLRKSLVLLYLKRFSIDILCLQETKVVDELFPLDFFAEQGYIYYALSGQKSYNGVAILSRIALESIGRRDFCQRDDCRYISACFALDQEKVTLHNFYVPAGGDIPDRQINEKFGHKLDFLAEMADYLKNCQGHNLIVGDFNIAPLVHDVWGHKQLLSVVSHTGIECEALMKVKQAGPFIDVVREKWPEPERLYSWWSYRAKDWKKSNRGRRLDHIWTSFSLAQKVRDIHIDVSMRGEEQPSDHVPLYVEFSGEKKLYH